MKTLFVTSTATIALYLIMMTISPVVLASYEVKLVTHVQEHGDQEVVEGHWSIPRRHEGFFISTDLPGVSIEYDCHVKGIGDYSHEYNGGKLLKDGQYCGAQPGHGIRIEAFRIKLTGPNAHHYKIEYYCKQHRYWNYEKRYNEVKTDGEWCGYKGRYVPLLGMKVIIRPAY